MDDNDCRSTHIVAAYVTLMQQAGAQYDLDPDNASILVAGGAGVALNVTRRLKNMGSWVWQLQRTDKLRKDIEGMMAIVAKGDAMSNEDLQKVFDGVRVRDGGMAFVFWEGARGGMRT